VIPAAPRLRLFPLLLLLALLKLLLWPGCPAALNLRFVPSGHRSFAEGRLLLLLLLVLLLRPRLRLSPRLLHLRVSPLLLILLLVVAMLLLGLRLRLLANRRQGPRPQLAAAPQGRGKDRPVVRVGPKRPWSERGAADGRPARRKGPAAKAAERTATMVLETVRREQFPTPRGR
jgi:hypothetical protein